jgi:hypothetical protein
MCFILMCEASRRNAVGELARDLENGCYAVLVGHLVTVNPQSINSLPPPKQFGDDPTGDKRCGWNDADVSVRPVSLIRWKTTRYESFPESAPPFKPTPPGSEHSFP